jgi:hypothetical protein
MTNEDFAKLPNTTIHVLVIKIRGKEDLFIKSKSMATLESKLNSFDYYDYSIKSFTVKDTFESDDSHELCGIKSIKGEYI